jgi:hypothetical protein
MVMGCEGQLSAAAAHEATMLSIAASEYEQILLGTNPSSIALNVLARLVGAYQAVRLLPIAARRGQHRIGTLVRKAPTTPSVEFSRSALKKYRHPR